MPQMLSAVMWRAGSGTSQHSNEGEIGPSTGGAVGYLGRARAKASLSRIEFARETGYILH
jgi:hypothetical protein